MNNSIVRLPQPFYLPARVIPDKVHSAIITRLLNKLLATPLKDDELDFLNDRTLLIAVSDVGITFSISVKNHRFIPGRPDSETKTARAAGQFDTVARNSRCWSR